MSFTRMDQSTASDWEAIFVAARSYAAELPARIMATLRQLERLQGAYSVNQLTHCLQTATLAERANAPDDLVVGALCHDMGKVITVRNHGAIAAEILWPYVSEETYRIILNHQEFQGRYYFEHTGNNPEARVRFAGESWFALAEKFVDEWDQVAFDPNGETFPLEHFEPLVRKTFSSARRNRFE